MKYSMKYTMMWITFLFLTIVLIYCISKFLSNVFAVPDFTSELILFYVGTLHGFAGGRSGFGLIFSSVFEFVLTFMVLFLSLKYRNKV